MRRTMVMLVAGFVVIGLAACSPDYQAERDGKDLGQALCDIRTADSVDAARAGVDDAKQALESMKSSVGIPDGENVDAIRDAIAQLAESIGDRDRDAAQEDVTTLRETLVQAEEDASGAVQAAYSGILQGLGECD